MQRFIFLCLFLPVLAFWAVDARALLAEKAPARKGASPEPKQTLPSPMPTASLPEIPNVPKIPKMEPIPMTARTPVVDPVDIQEMQRQIQETLRIHETLKAEQLSRTVQLQRVTEQAKIHQQILRALESARQARAAQVQIPQNLAVDEGKIRESTS